MKVIFSLFGNAFDNSINVTNTFASYRLFKLLKFLSENKASVKNIIKYLEFIDY